MTHLQAFQKELAKKAEAALITSPQNQFYLSRFPFEDGFLLILPDVAYLLTDFRYFEAASKACGGEFEVLSPETGAFFEIGKLLDAHGATTLLVEESNLTLSLQARLAEQFPTLQTITGASAILRELRVYKDEQEIAATAAAQEITDAAFAHILDFIRKDRTEREIALELEVFMRKHGAEAAAFQTIAVSGTASALPHGVPRDCTLESGFLTMDFGARYAGYCADMTRTVMIGRADAEQKRLYETVLKAQKAALAAAGGGVGCAAMDKIARDIIHGAGYVGCFGHSLGHGVGIDVHEAPSLSSRAPASALLTSGQIVTVEPGIYLLGKYGCRIEDMIAINEDGSIRNFTKSPKELIEICR